VRPTEEKEKPLNRHHSATVDFKFQERGDLPKGRPGKKKGSQGVKFPGGGGEFFQVEEETREKGTSDARGVGANVLNRLVGVILRKGGLIEAKA